MPLFRWRPWYAICVELSVTTVILAAAHAFGPAVLRFAGFVSFLPIILIGQILWAIRAHRLDPRAALGAGTVRSMIMGVLTPSRIS